MSALPIPELHRPESCRLWGYRPAEQGILSAARGWRERWDIAPSDEDSETTLLLLVDLQKDFCLPEGRLFVAGEGGTGATDDTRRITSFIYRNLSRITDIVYTLDTHLPHHIFFSSFWVDSLGSSPEPHREVTLDDLRSGLLRPNPAIASWLSRGGGEWLSRQVEHYCEELERRGRYTLYLWPAHCLLGSAGHALVGAVQEARLFHAFVRSAEAPLVLKGMDPLTESYSVLGPEVDRSHDGEPLSGGESGIGERLLAADRLIIAGQAASHCVRSTLLDLREWITRKKPELMERVFVLRDCMSPVVVAGARGELVADFSPQAEEMLRECRLAGMQVVESSDSMEGWC